jgi:outer membrane immunogenic protein
MTKTIFHPIMAAIAALALQGGAMAADIPVAPRYGKAPPIALDLWSGGYLGVSAGGRWTTEEWTTTTPNSSHEFESSSARLGLYGGYNWQVQPRWIVGLEADIAWANNHASMNSIPGMKAGRTGTTELKDMQDGGLRARVGYLVTPSTMLFASGGVAWMQNQIDVSSVTTTRVSNYCAPDTILTSRASDSVSKTNMGWSLGGGLETAVAANWLLRGEYRYNSYGNQNVSLMKGADRIDVNFDRHTTQTVLVGLAYQFGK